MQLDWHFFLLFQLMPTQVQQTQQPTQIQIVSADRIRFSCEECGMTFATQGELKTHKIQNHQQQQQQQQQQQVWNQWFIYNIVPVFTVVLYFTHLLYPVSGHPLAMKACIISSNMISSKFLPCVVNIESLSYRKHYHWKNIIKGLFLHYMLELW